MVKLNEHSSYDIQQVVHDKTRFCQLEEKRYYHAQISIIDSMVHKKASSNRNIERIYHSSHWNTAMQI